MVDQGSIQRVFDGVLRDLDFHQSIISRSRGRMRKYPFRTLRYVATNTIWKAAIRLGHGPIIKAKTFWGDRMFVVFPTYRSVYNFGILDSWELLVQKALIAYLRPGDTFMDIGANVGFYSLLASALVGKEGKVFSFEPTPSTFELLKKNTRDRANITLNPFALGPAKGEATLADYGVLESGLNSLVHLEYAGLASKKITVPVVTLDAYCQEHNVRPKMLKIDTEGMESLVLEGAEETLKNAKPILVLEVGSPEESKELLDYIFARGYQGYTADEKMEFVPYSASKHHGRINMIFIAK